jgi:hypothetical protein
MCRRICVLISQQRVDHVFLSVGNVKVRTPFSWQANPIEEVCEFSEMGAKVIHAIAS